jgi:uncharacterized protein (TIGR03000 family)
MYTAVLMIAVTAGADSVEFGGRRGCRGGGGCSGSYGCSSSSYGCSGSYSGGCCSSYRGGRSSSYNAPGVYSNGVAQTTTPNRQSFYPPGQNAVNIRVLVPNADAEIWFDDSTTTQRGMERTFQSPPLDINTRYNYTVKARWTDNGQTVNQERRVEVQPGGQVTIVDFRAKTGEKLTVPKMPDPVK